MADYTLSARATYNGSNFDKGIKGSESALERFRAKCSTVSIAMGNILANLAGKGFSALTSSIDSAVSRVDTMRNFPKVMSNLGYSADDASEAVAKMSDRLQGLPTTLDSMTSGVQRLVPSVQDVGKATDIMLAFNDAVLAGGAPIEVQNAALEQFSQGVAKGKIELEEWRSICTAMPGQMDQMAKSMLGASAGQQDLYEALKNGTVSMDEFLDTLVRLDQEGGEGFASFQQQAEDGVSGIATAAENTANAVTRGMASVIEALGVENIVGVLNTVKGGINDTFSAIAGGVETFVGQLEENGAVQTAQELFGGLAQAGRDVMSAFGGMVGALLGIPEGTDPAVAAADALKAALEAAKPIVEGIKDAAAWLKDNAAQAAPAVAALAAAFAAFRIAQGVSGFITSFKTALSGVQGVATPAATAIGGIGNASAMSAPQILALGAAVLLVGVGVLAASAGLALLATAAIQIAAAGPGAAIAMTLMVAAIAGLAAGAALLGPALTAGALGIGVFGAAVLAVGVGILAATAGIALLATQLPTISQYGASAAVGLAALGAGALAATPGLIAAGAAALVFGAGMTAAAVGVAAASAAVMLAAAAVTLFGVALTVAGAGALVLSASLPGIAANGAAAGAAMTVLAAGLTLIGAGALVAGAGITVFGAGALVAAAGITALGLAVTVAAAGVTLLGAGAMVLAAAVMMLAAGVVVAAAGITAMGTALPAIASSAPGAAAGIAAFAAAAAAATVGLLAGTPALVAYSAAAVAAAAGVTTAAAGTVLLGTGVTLIAASAPRAASGISALASAATSAAPALTSAAPALTAASAASVEAASGFTTAAASATVVAVAFTASAAAASDMASSFTAASVAVVAGMTMATASVTAFGSATQSSMNGVVSATQAAMAIFTREMGQQSVLAMQQFNIAITSGTDQAVSTISTLPGRIQGILGGVSLYSSGLSMMQGFASGISAGFRSAISAAAAGMSELRSYFPFSPAKKGPFSGSGYTTHSGKALVEDFAKGIEDNGDAPVDAVVEVGTKVADTSWEYGYHAAVNYADGLASGSTKVEDAASGLGDSATEGLEDSDAEMQAYIDEMIAGYKARTHELQKVSTELADAIWGPLMTSINSIERVRPDTGEVYASMKALEAAGYTLDSYEDKINEIASGTSEADEAFTALQGSVGSTVAEMREWESLYTLKDDLITDMDVAESWSDSLGKLFNKTGVRFSKNFVDRIMEGGEDYREAVAQMADMTDEQVQQMVDSFDDLARAEREQELNQRSLYINSLRYFDMTEPQDWLLDFRETCLDVKEAVYSDSGLSKAFEMAGYSIEQCASDLRGMNMTMEDFQSGMQSFTDSVSDGFNQMTKYGKTGLDEWAETLRLNMAESQKYSENMQEVFAKIPESIDSEAFRQAVYEGGFDQWGQVMEDMAKLNADEIGEYIQLYNDAILEGQQSAIEQFRALSPGDEVVNSLVEGIAAGKEQIAESMGQLLTEGMQIAAESDETIAEPMGEVISQAFASDAMAEQIASAMSTLVSGMGNGIVANAPVMNASVAEVAQQGNDTASGFYGDFYNTGANLAHGIAAGIQSQIAAIAAAAAAVVRAAIAAAQAEAGIASPSKVMRDKVGEMMPAGVAVGIENAGHIAVAAMEGVTEDVIDAAVPSALSLAPSGGYEFSLGSVPGGSSAVDGGYYSYGGDTWYVTVRDDRDIEELQRAMNRNNDRKMRAVGIE